LQWLIDPDLHWRRQWLRRFTSEAFGMSQVGRVQNCAALFDCGGREAVMDHGTGQQAQPGMPMLFVVLAKNSWEKPSL
jgi:hypothetical protein